MLKERMQLLEKLLFFSEFIALIAGLTSWKTISDKKVKAFVLYIAVIVISEQIGYYLGRSNYRYVNMMFMNYLVIPLEFIFLYVFFYMHLQGRMAKNICLFFSVTSILVRILEFTLLKGSKYIFSSLSYVVSDFFLLIILMIFLWQFINSDKLLNYHRHFVFWVSIALLVFYLGTFPLYTFYNFLYKEHEVSFNLYWQIMMCLNIFMYLSFAAGLIWTNRRKYQSLSL